MIGATIYLAGLGAFDTGASEPAEPTVENGELTVTDSQYTQPMGSVTYMPPPENPLAEDPGFFAGGIFSLVEWLEILGGIAVMIGTTLVIRKYDMEARQAREELMNFDA